MSPRSELNRQMVVYKTTAVPIEPLGLNMCLSTSVIPPLYSVNLKGPNGKAVSKTSMHVLKESNLVLRIWSSLGYLSLRHVCGGQGEF